MNGLAVRILPYVLAFFSSLCIMILELVASRLVARHVGASLSVWTSVIGIMLGGICLGNVLGGRLADRVEPGKAIGPLYGLGAFLSLSCLWMNAVVGLTPGLESLSWNLRTLVVVTLDFLVPATVLGMIGPVVAKIAVTHAKRAGSAIGDVYFMGAVGSIAGTFLAGFILMYVAPVSTIVTLVAAALALLAAALIGDVRGSAIGLLAALALGLGSIAPVARSIPVHGIMLGSVPINPLALAGHVLTVALAVLAVLRLRTIAREQPGAVADAAASQEAASERPRTETEVVNADWTPSRPRLADLAALSFVASLTFMALEMVAGRMVTRHLGSSIYGWTSVIGVLLGGLSLGNFLGGKVADHVHKESQASWLFMAASIFTLSILLLETMTYLKHAGYALIGLSLLGILACYVLVVIQMFRRGLSGPAWISLAGLLIGGIGPLYAFVFGWLRAREWRTLTTMLVWTGLYFSAAVGCFIVYETYAHEWLTEHSSLLSQAITMTTLKLPGLAAIPLAWSARVLLVTTVVFFLPSITMGTVSPVVAKLAVERVRKSDLTGRAIGQVYAWGMVGSILGTFLAGFVLIDLLGTKGLLLILGTSLAMAATMLGSVWHALWAGIPLGLCVLAFVPGVWFEKQGINLGLREEKGNPATTEEALAWADESDYYFIKVSNEPDADGQKRTLVLDNLIHGYFILDHPERLDYDYEHIYALVSKRVAQTKAKAAKDAADAKDGDPPPSNLSALFLGGGAYTFQRYVQHTYPGTPVDVAEIDPAVTNANHKALGLPLDTPIKTTWGDARQFVEKQQDQKKYDLIYGDAFNDFSVPWHLTTREFNEKLNRMLTPEGVYMINIIDVYESDETAAENARKEIDKNKVTSKAEQERIKKEHLDKARAYGGFLGAWVNTAKQTFPHVAIFGTDDNPGAGLRETFVVVASKQPIKMDDLGSRDDDPQFFQDDRLFEPRPFGPDHVKAIEIRSRGIVLTDDFAPVENLLAPVAATRGEED